MSEKSKRFLNLENIRLTLGGALCGSALGGISWLFVRQYVTYDSMTFWGAISGGTLAAIWLFVQWKKGC